MPAASPPLPLQGIIVGRPRDGNDRVSWLSERGRLAEALRVAEEDSSGKQTLGRVGWAVQDGRQGKQLQLQLRQLGWLHTQQ